MRQLFLNKHQETDQKQPTLVSTVKGFGQYASVDLKDGWMMDLCSWCPRLGCPVSCMVLTL